MNMLELKNLIGRKGCDALAVKIGSSTEYLSQIAHGRRQPSEDLCRKLVKADARLTLMDLRPDLFAKPGEIAGSISPAWAAIMHGIGQKRRA